MYCPSCRCEFRPGFTHCESCDRDLVESLDAVPEVAVSRPAPAPVRMADYCGFLSLDEAREARDRLRAVRVRSEIAIRESPESNLASDVREEYWLRVEAAAFAAAAALLGMHEEPLASDGSFACGDCGATVAEEATACPKCGARFDEA
jgi:hypothetical protein